MKITKSQIKQIIEEELENAKQLQTSKVEINEEAEDIISPVVQAWRRMNRDMNTLARHIEKIYKKAEVMEAQFAFRYIDQLRTKSWRSVGKKIVELHGTLNHKEQGQEPEKE